MLKIPVLSSPCVQLVFVLGLSLQWAALASDLDFGLPTGGVENEVLSRSSRQATLEEQCSFDPVAGDAISTCDLITDVKRFDVADWTTGKGEFAIWQGGPSTDASNSPDGGYGFIETSQLRVSNVNKETAWLLTKQTPSTGPDGRCLAFRFATDGLSFSSLEVFLIQFEDEVDFANESKPAYDTKRLWLENDRTGGEWSNSSVTYTSKGFHSLAFAAKNNAEYPIHPGYAAIDDIAISVGPCERDCHFDKNLCSFNNDEADDVFDWVLSRGSGKRGTGPASIHLTSVDQRFAIGGCAILDSAYPRRPGDTARLVSQTIEAKEEPLCLSFWVNMYGSGIGSLSVKVLVPATNATKTVWKQEGSLQTDRWIKCQTSISSPEDYVIIFEGEVGEPDSGDIGLDTVSFTPEECPRLPPGLDESSTADCTFTTSQCSWTVENEENLDNPFLDLAVGGKSNLPGHTEYSHSVYNIPDKYAKFDLSSYRNRARQSAALSHKVATPASYCLSFWIFMYAPVATERKLGSLQVVVRGEGNQTVWRLSNQQQSTWTKVKVPLQLDQPATIAIQGTKGKNLPGGMIGVDDITLYEGTCEIEPVAASVTPLDCSFDKGVCGWTVRNPNQDERPVANWMLTNNTSFISMRDHTFSMDKGGYMLIETFSSDYKSQLVSPSIPANEEYCLNFYFAQYFKDSDARLTVYLKDLNTNDLARVWEVDKANPAQTRELKAYEWEFAQVSLPGSTSPQQIYIEGQVGMSAWAVDDVRLHPGITNCGTRPKFLKG